MKVRIFLMNSAVCARLSGAGANCGPTDIPRLPLPGRQRSLRPKVCRSLRAAIRGPRQRRREHP